MAFAARHAVADRGEVFLVGRLERDADMVVPGLGDKADRIGLGVEQRGQARIVRGRAPGPPRHAERGECRVQSAMLGEQFGVGRIGAGIAALDIVDAEFVEHARRSRRLSCSVKSTPLVCAPSRSVVSNR